VTLNDDQGIKNPGDESSMSPLLPNRDCQALRLETVFKKEMKIPLIDVLCVLSGSD
jgi:hypothetical protein